MNPPKQAPREWLALIDEAKAYVGPRIEAKSIYATERLLIEIIEKYETEFSALLEAEKGRDFLLEAIKAAEKDAKYFEAERDKAQELLQKVQISGCDAVAKLTYELHEARAEIERLKRDLAMFRRHAEANYALLVRSEEKVEELEEAFAKLKALKCGGGA